jgi:16S rRNA (cytosine967-C5)-methyltransferase
VSRPPADRRPARDGRSIAHEVLVRVAAADSFADVLLADRLVGPSIPPEEAALATRLVYGTLAWQARLDHHLRPLVSGGLERLDPTVLVTLRLGLYQLVFLTRMPVYAVVDASVELARRTAGTGAAGLVNAVLRRITRLGSDALSLPPADGDPLARLALEWSHPRWLVEQWAREFGP